MTLSRGRFIYGILLLWSMANLDKKRSISSKKAVSKKSSLQKKIDSLVGTKYKAGFSTKADSTFDESDKKVVDKYTKTAEQKEEFLNSWKKGEGSPDGFYPLRVAQDAYSKTTANTATGPTLSDFKKWAKKNPNFITNNQIKVKRLNDNKFAELSSGTGMSGENIYAVSVIERDDRNSFRSASFSGDNRGKPFGSREEAESYYNSIK